MIISVWRAKLVFPQMSWIATHRGTESVKTQPNSMEYKEIILNHKWRHYSSDSVLRLVSNELSNEHFNNNRTSKLCIRAAAKKKLVLHLIVRIVKIRRRQFSTEFNNRMMTENVTNDETTKRRNKRHDQMIFFFITHKHSDWDTIRQTTLISMPNEE